MDDAAPSYTAISGTHLLHFWTAASEHLRANAAAIDAINVYPVPDGDTGSNMSATLREAVEMASTGKRSTGRSGVNLPSK